MNSEDTGPDQFVGQFETTLGTLMGSRKQSLNKELSLNENIDTTKKKP